MNTWAGVILITKDNKIILQKRDINPKITNSGMNAIFGGGVEEGEDLETAAKRELKEETNFNLTEIKYFGLYKKRQATHGEDCNCHVFIAENINPDDLIIKEGIGYILIGKNDKIDKSKFSAITQDVITDYFK